MTQLPSSPSFTPSRSFAPVSGSAVGTVVRSFVSTALTHFPNSTRRLVCTETTVLPRISALLLDTTTFLCGTRLLPLGELPALVRLSPRVLPLRATASRAQGAWSLYRDFLARVPHARISSNPLTRPATCLESTGTVCTRLDSVLRTSSATRASAPRIACALPLCPVGARARCSLRGPVASQEVLSGLMCHWLAGPVFSAAVRSLAAAGSR